MKNIFGIPLACLLVIACAKMGSPQDPLKKLRSGLNANEVGNGGDVVACRNNQGRTESLRLLDYYESSGIDLGEPSLSPADKIRLVLGRLSKLDPKRAAEYQQKADAFLENTVMTKGQLLSETLDYGYIRLPSNCEIQQLAIQKQPTSPDTRLYTINEDLWNQLDNDSKAGLMLHEIVYGDALRRGHKTSVATRKYNGLISSSALSRMERAAYDGELKRLSLSDSSSAHHPHWVQNPLVVSACVNSDLSFDLSQYALDPDGAPATISAPNRPHWLYMSDLGHLIGHPTGYDVGKHQFIVVASKGDLSDKSVFKLEVILCQTGESPLPPQFRATAGEMFSLDLTGVTKMLGKHTKISGPVWLSVSSRGFLFGSPSKADIGRNLVEVKIDIDGGGTITWKGFVEVSSALSWKTDVMSLGIQMEERPFRFDLNPFVMNPEGKILSFRCLSLPSWLRVSSEGVLAGTPRRTDIGKYAATCYVSDGLAELPVTVSGEVIKQIHAPKWIADPITLPEAFEDTAYAQDLSRQVINPEASILKFSIISGPSWIRVSPNGTMMGTPQKADVGANEVIAGIQTTIDGQAFEDTARVRLVVRHVSHPPVWTINPIRFETKAKQPFTASLSQYAKSPDGDPLVFVKLGGPSWLTITVTGDLAGTPSVADEGENSFVVRVSSPSGGADDATVVIRVKE